MMGSCRLVLLFLVFFGFFACNSKKEGEKSPKSDISERPQGLAENGKALFATCQTCHGNAGQGNARLNAPTLVNLDGWYLYRQLMNFKHGVRGYLPGDTLGMQMAAMAKTLKDSLEVSNVVAYIETLPDTTAELTLTGDFKKGERTYQSICGSCHGPMGKGNEAMHAPRLNGLNDWYLKRQLISFKNLLRGVHPKDQYGTQMVPMADMLGDDQSINDVIVYIRSAKPDTQ